MKYYTDGSLGSPSLINRVSQAINPVVTTPNVPLVTTVANPLQAFTENVPVDYSNYNTYPSQTDYSSYADYADDVVPKMDLISRMYSVPAIGNILGNTAQNIQHTGQRLGTDISGMTGLQKVQSIGGLLQGAYGAYNAYKQNKLANEAFNFSKKQWKTDHDNQVKTLNAQLGDRQAARVAQADAEARATGRTHNVTSVADYMKKYGVR